MTIDIPTISLAPCFASDGHSDSSAKRALARRIDEVCTSSGFLLVREHGLNLKVLDDAFALSSGFFDCEQVFKDRWHPTTAGIQRGYHGYETRALAATLGNDTPPDMRESFFLGPLDDHLAAVGDLPGASATYAANIYPYFAADLAGDSAGDPGDRLGDDPSDRYSPQTRGDSASGALAGFSPALMALYREFESLSANLLRLMAIALGAPEDYFDAKIAHHFSILASHFYPPPTVSPKSGQLRTGEHTDFGAFTILAMTAGAGGLEVRMPNGEWRGVQAQAGELVVNLGDMMARWTNDRWVSTLHRVANPAASDFRRARRQSIGYFMHPDYDARVECIPSVLAPGTQAKYPVITAGEHIRSKIVRSHGDAN